MTKDHKENQFGKLIRRERKNKGYTQRAFAELIGVDHTYISRIENGLETSPSEELIHKMGMALGYARYPRFQLVIMTGKIPTEFKNVILNDEDACKDLFARLMRSERSDKVAN